MRGQPPLVVPRIALTVRLPADLKTKLDLHLYSTAEGRVPYGAHQKFLIEVLERYFSSLETKDVTNS